MMTYVRINYALIPVEMTGALPPLREKEKKYEHCRDISRGGRQSHVR